LIIDSSKKISLIRDIRAVTGVGLVEAKGIVENSPKVIKEEVSHDDAMTIKELLEASGGIVDIK